MRERPPPTLLVYLAIWTAVALLNVVALALLVAGPTRRYVAR